MLKNWSKGHWLTLLLLPVTTLFFLGGPNAVALPVERYAWNLGHIVFFMTATFAYAHFKPFSSKRQVYLFLLSILILSFAIELLQLFTGRDFSTTDVLRNLIGSTLALLFLARTYLNISIISFFAFVLLLDLTGFTLTAVTDFRQQTQAPIIEDFEHFSSLQYWRGNLEQTEEHLLDGQYAGKVLLKAGRYSGINQSPTLANWSGYAHLELNIFNPTTKSQTLTVRINDEAHELSSQEYSDRFNQQVELSNGWNKIVFALKAIQQAPENRDMDLTKMYRIGIFYGELDEDTYLFFDQFRLIK